MQIFSRLKPKINTVLQFDMIPCLQSEAFSDYNSRRRFQIEVYSEETSTAHTNRVLMLFIPIVRLLAHTVEQLTFTNTIDQFDHSVREIRTNGCGQR
jgi:hypothetical protein